MKAIIVTSVASMVEQFLFPSAELLAEMGYEVTIACNFTEGNTCTARQTLNLIERMENKGIQYVQIDFSRDIKRVDRHIKAYRQIKRVLKNDVYTLIHCHSPIGGFLTRAALGKKHRGRLIYTAHGFHFYKGASAKEWLMFFPIEYIASKCTDILITINTEDYVLAKKRLCAKKTVYIPGVGINRERIRSSDSFCEEYIKFKKHIGVREGQAVFLSVGELNKNKNHISVIKALGALYKSDMAVNWVYVICGQGSLKKTLMKKAKQLNISDRVIFAGYMEDIGMALECADLYIHPSYREGLSVALMEAIAAGCPVICSDIRGNRDIVDKALLFAPENVGDIQNKIRMFLKCSSNEKYHKMFFDGVKVNEEKLKKCEIENVMTALKELYKL